LMNYRRLSLFAEHAIPSIKVGEVF